MYLWMVTGGAAGDVRMIRSNTSSSIFIYGTFSYDVAPGADFRIFSYTGTLTDPMVIIQSHDGEAWRRSADWLPIGASGGTVWLEETNIGTLGITTLLTPGYLG